MAGGPAASASPAPSAFRTARCSLPAKAACWSPPIPTFAERCPFRSQIADALRGTSFYDHDRLGTNFRLTAFQAAVLIAQFERLNEQIETRTANARLLRKLLSDVPDIVWQEQSPQTVTQKQLLSDARARCVPIVPTTRDEFQGRLRPPAFHARLSIRIRSTRIRCSRRRHAA